MQLHMLDVALDFGATLGIEVATKHETGVGQLRRVWCPLRMARHVLHECGGEPVRQTALAECVATHQTVTSTDAVSRYS